MLKINYIEDFNIYSDCYEKGDGVYSAELNGLEFIQTVVKRTQSKEALDCVIIRTRDQRGDLKKMMEVARLCDKNFDYYTANNKQTSEEFIRKTSGGGNLWVKNWAHANEIAQQLN